MNFYYSLLYSTFPPLSPTFSLVSFPSIHLFIFLLIATRSLSFSLHFITSIIATFTPLNTCFQRWLQNYAHFIASFLYAIIKLKLFVPYITKSIHLAIELPLKDECYSFSLQKVLMCISPLHQPSFLIKFPPRSISTEKYQTANKI